MKKIEALTSQQEEGLISFRQAMWLQGVSTASADRMAAEKAIADAYADVGRPPPRFFWMPSPMTCSLALYVLGRLADSTTRQIGAGLEDGLGDGLRAGLGAGLEDGLGDGLRAGLGAGLGDGLWDGLWAGLGAGLGDGLWAGLGDGLGAGLGAGLEDGLGDGLGAQRIDPSIGDTWWRGQMDTFWLAFYRFPSMIGVAQKPDLLRRLDIMERIAASCGFWYPRDGICVVSDRFAGVSWDETRNRVGLPSRLHSDSGPAIAFRDGWGLYYWHGFRLPPGKEWVIADKGRLSPDAIEAEENAELRRVMLEVFGFDRYCSEREARVIDADVNHEQPRRLLEVTVRGEPIRVLDVTNGSQEPDGSRRRFHLGAMPGAQTVREAVAMSYGIAPAVYREAIRT